MKNTTDYGLAEEHYLPDYKIEKEEEKEGDGKDNQTN